MLMALAISRNIPVKRKKRLTGKSCFSANPESSKPSEHKGFTLPSRASRPLMPKDFRVSSDPLMRVLRGKCGGSFLMSPLARARRRLVIFCERGISGIFSPVTRRAAVQGSGTVALEAACLTPQRLREQPDLPAHCPKKVSVCPKSDKGGQSSNPNQTIPATGCLADMPSAGRRCPSPKHPN